jgi:Na+/H+ antiporter NhaA
VLPTGLTLNATTGAITGTPTTPGSYTFTVTAANGTAPDVSAVYSITVSAPPAAVRGVAAQGELAATGTDALPLVAAAGGLLAMGLVFLVIRTVTRRRTN